MGAVRVVLLALAVVVATPLAAFAQATLSGLVRDTSGAVLPGVTVEASSPVLIEKVRTGVTDGTLMKGVRFFGDGIRTSSLVMQTNPHRIRFIDSIQVYPGPSVKIRF